MRNILAFVATLALSAPALAATNTVFDNQSTFTGTGHCVYNTTCASMLDFGGNYAAQKFSLGADTVLSGGGVTNYTAPGVTDIGSINWMVFAADGTAGMPGTLLATGKRSAITSLTVLSVDELGYYDLSLAKFSMPSLELGAGDYYIALQAVTTQFRVYLSAGDAVDGGAQTRNGGDSWTSGYQGYSSIAVSLYGIENVAAVVPEPASWALMIVGFGMIGASMRRRASTVRFG